MQWEFHDDRGDASMARTIAEAVVADGRYAVVIGHFNSAGARAAIPAYRAAGLPVLLPLATAPRLLAGMPGTASLVPGRPPSWSSRSAIRKAGHASGGGAATAAAMARRWALFLAQPGEAPLLSAVDDAATALIVCGTHVGAVRTARARRRAGFAGVFYFTDDCAVAEFGELLGGAAGLAFVTRLRGGAAAHVQAAFAAAARALAAMPGGRGRDLLEAVRSHADRQFTPEGEPVPRPPGSGWEVAAI